MSHGWFLKIFESLVIRVLSAYVANSIACDNLIIFILLLYWNLAQSNDFYYGSTSLSKKGRKRGIPGTRTPRHSLLLFRGTIFEWGIATGAGGWWLWKTRSFRIGYNPASCDISWHNHREGESRCTKNEIITWTRQYEGRYGKYSLLDNNCHHFVRHLRSKLNTNCGHWFENTSLYSCQSFIYYTLVKK